MRSPGFDILMLLIERKNLAAKFTKLSILEYLRFIALSEMPRISGCPKRLKTWSIHEFFGGG
jgi:hypothetical protein